jgi:hypothetical protein
MAGVCFARVTGWPERVFEAQSPGGRLGPRTIAKGRSTAGTLAQTLEVLFVQRRVDTCDPIGQPRHGTRMQEGLEGRVDASRQTRPGPLLGRVDQTGTKRVAFDVAEDRQQVIVLLDRKGFEPALPNMTATAVLFAVATDMGGHEPVHPVAEVAVALGPDGQVKMIGHQAEGQDAHRHAGRGLADELDEVREVAVVVEDLSAGIAPVENMVAIGAHCCSRCTWHERYFGLAPIGGQE